jgi:two-component system KDP operon response regulator KdpE
LGEEGAIMVEEHKPDIVILDLGLPDISGFSVLSKIRLFSSVPIIILSVRGEEKDVVHALDLGADEYITKPFRQMELLARVKAMLSRSEPAKENLSISYGSLHFGQTFHDIVLRERNITLTQAEARILYRLMEGNGKVVTISQLARAVWGNNYSDTSENIKVYIHRLRQKIEGEIKRPQLILNKPNIGYFLAPPDQF